MIPAVINEQRLRELAIANKKVNLAVAIDFKCPSCGTKHREIIHRYGYIGFGDYMFDDESHYDEDYVPDVSCPKCEYDMQSVAKVIYDILSKEVFFRVSATDALNGCYENASTEEGDLIKDWIEDSSRDGLLKETLEECSYQLFKDELWSWLYPDEIEYAFEKMKCFYNRNGNKSQWKKIYKEMNDETKKEFIGYVTEKFINRRSFRYFPIAILDNVMNERAYKTEYKNDLRYPIGFSLVPCKPTTLISFYHIAYELLRGLKDEKRVFLLDSVPILAPVYKLSETALFYMDNYLKLERKKTKEESLQHNLETKLHTAYEKIRELENNKVVYERDPRDKMKIDSLREMVKELRESVSYYESILPEEDEPEVDQEDLEVAEIAPEEDKIDMSILSGKKIFLIGGHTENVDRTNKYGAEILQQMKPKGSGINIDFHHYLRQADAVFVLIGNVKHTPYYVSKEYCQENDIPFAYGRFQNTERILTEVAKVLAKNN